MDTPSYPQAHLHPETRLLRAMLVLASWVSHVHHTDQPDNETKATCGVSVYSDFPCHRGTLDGGGSDQSQYILFAGSCSLPPNLPLSPKRNLEQENINVGAG